jgi:hypothetical protein
MPNVRKLPRRSLVCDDETWSLLATAATRLGFSGRSELLRAVATATAHQAMLRPAEDALRIEIAVQSREKQG